MLQLRLAEFPRATWGTYTNRLKIGGVKVTIDGSPQGRTAFFSTPYLTGGPGGEKDWTGELAASEEVITKAVKAVYDMGVPLNLHANGDGAIDAFLRAHEKAAAGDLGKGIREFRRGLKDEPEQSPPPSSSGDGDSKLS